MVCGVVWAGGDASSGANAGAFCSHANDAVAVSSAHYSSPLCYFEEDPLMS